MMQMMIIHPIFLFGGLCTMILDTQDHFVEKATPELTGFSLFVYRLFLCNFVFPHLYCACFNVACLVVKLTVPLIVRGMFHVACFLFKFVYECVLDLFQNSSVPLQRGSSHVVGAVKEKRRRRVAAAVVPPALKKPRKVKAKNVLATAPRRVQKSILEFPVYVNVARAPKKARTPAQEERQITNLMMQVGCTRTDSREVLRRRIAKERALGCY